MSEIIYLMTCTEDTEVFYNENGVEGLKNDTADYKLMKIIIDNKKSVIDGFYYISLYGNYYILSEDEYYKVKRLDDSLEV